MASADRKKLEAFEETVKSSPEIAEIDELRKRWELDMDNNLLRFQYASVLARSSVDYDRREAILHLEYLINQSPEYLRDSLYILATLRYLMHEYEAARACAEELLRIDPDNEQVKNLHIAVKYRHEKEVEEKSNQEKNVGIAVGIGFVVTAIAALGLTLLASRKK